MDSIRFTVNGETVSPGGRSSRGSGEIQINGSDSVSDLDGLYTISGGGEISRVDGDPYVITGSGSVAPAGEGGKHLRREQPGGRHGDRCPAGPMSLRGAAGATRSA